MNRIHDIAGDDVALEERAHVGVRLPEVLRVGRLDADAMRTIADRREHVLDPPGLGIDPIDHPARWHGDPEFAVLRLLAVRAGARRRRTGIAGNGSSPANAEPIRRASRRARSWHRRRAGRSGALTLTVGCRWTHRSAVRVWTRWQVGGHPIDDARPGREMLL